MVKPGGTGRPRLAISARLAPLPPSRSRSCALPSPKVNTHLPDFAASVLTLLATLLAAGFFAADFRPLFDATFFGATGAAGLAGLFLTGLLPRGLRARESAALPRSGLDDFDFAAAFLVFDAALAMAYKHPRERKEWRPYNTFLQLCGNCRARF